ncbi:MAG: YggS family pyridoxal phosphate-dependent enzyme [Lachnospiraceae bacterium]|nr:YggS family pyridoxal phosphate-dependent enzyme [Lachnospiraceae bacterium]
MLTEVEIRENLKEVEEKICAAVKKAGRNRSDVKLISVSKTNPVEVLEAAYRCGVRVFGENRVQELVEKMDYFESKGIKDIEWHLIGHLQTNKVKYIAGRVAMIHSVDTEKLAKVISDESAKKGVVTDILIELNIGDEDSKFGLESDDLANFVKNIAILPNIRVKGLMCVAPITDDPEKNRKFFNKMYKLSVDIRDKNIDNVNMCELSMGMTGDYTVAIEEGATFVRVGTGIFGKRNYGVQQ